METRLLIALMLSVLSAQAQLPFIGSHVQKPPAAGGGGGISAPYATGTKLRLHNTPSSVAGYKCMDFALGPAGRAVVTTVTTTTASGNDIQCTDIAGGSALAWISEPLSAAVTISSTVTLNIYGGESANTVNSAFRARLYKYSGGLRVHPS